MTRLGSPSVRRSAPRLPGPQDAGGIGAQTRMRLAHDRVARLGIEGVERRLRRTHRLRIGVLGRARGSRRAGMLRAEPLRRDLRHNRKKPSCRRLIHRPVPFAGCVAREDGQPERRTQ